MVENNKIIVDSEFLLNHAVDMCTECFRLFYQNSQVFLDAAKGSQSWVRIRFGYICEDCCAKDSTNKSNLHFYTQKDYTDYVKEEDE